MMRAGPLLRRVFLVTVLLTVLFGTFVAYGSVGPAPERNVYPDQRDLAGDYDRYVGDRVAIGGEVISTEPLVVAASDGRGGTVEYRITGTTERPAVGESLRVFGVAHPDRAIAVRDGFVVDEWGSSYAYGISALGGLWVLGRLVRRWRLDPEAGLVPRQRPLSLPTGIGRGGTRDPETVDEREKEDA